METKKYTVIDTRTGVVKPFESTATTLGELKRELSALGIPTTGMCIQEGLTHIELVNDDSVLPHDVPWKGTITNNLVFRITQTAEKTKSGVDRKELYAVIKARHLEGKVKEMFGRNFTQVPTQDLARLVLNNSREDKPCKKEEETVLGKIVDMINAILNVLYANGTIDDEDLHCLESYTGASLIKKGKNDSPYTEDELEEMFANM